MALYRGPSIERARLVTVSADPALVARFAAEMLARPADGSSDPVQDAIATGRRHALELVREEAGDEAGR